MISALLAPPLRHALALFGVSAMLAACGSPNDTSATHGAGSGGSPAGGSGGSGATSGSGGSGATGAAPTLSLPQFVHGAAYVDTTLFPTVPIVISASGEVLLDSVSITVNDQPTKATKDGDRFVAMLDAASLQAKSHSIVVQAETADGLHPTLDASLTTDSGSLQLTEFGKVGPAYNGHVVHDVAGDSLALTWVGAPAGKHQLFLSRLDGAFARIVPDDIVLNAPGDEPLSGYTAFGKDAIGVVYRTAKAGDVHWLVKMRVVDPSGEELVPAMDLTQGEAAFSMAQAGADPGGFSAAWLHIQPAPDPNNPPPVELRYARWDTAAKKLLGPITLDSDQPQPAGSMQGRQVLLPLAEIGIACNVKVCLVAYSRELYNALVDLNVPKLFLAVIDLATGQLKSEPEPVAGKDWDTQMFGQHLALLEDGSFALIYTANDTDAAVTPKTPCDESLQRDLLFAVKIDAEGAVQGAPKPVFDFEGTRQYPRIAVHPAGFAMLWEDQRSHCNPNGHIRMAANIAGPDLAALLDPYQELPGSIGLPPEDPTLAVIGTNVVTGWSDNRHGGGLLDPRNEIFLDTYWRK
jgi:hypothetical protein